jgi:hypothetical protein
MSWSALVEVCLRRWLWLWVVWEESLVSFYLEEESPSVGCAVTGERSCHPSG